MCEWFLSPYPWPGRLSDCCAAGWTGGEADGGAIGVAASTGAGAATGAAVWTTGALGAADGGGLGCGAGAGGVGVGVGVTAGGFGLGGCGARSFFAAGVCDDGVPIRTRFLETSAAVTGAFRTTVGARRPARGSAAATTTTVGAAL